MKTALFTVSQPALHLPSICGVIEWRVPVNYHGSPDGLREFSDHALFPPITATLDRAFLMHNLPHSWHARGRLKLRKEKSF